MITLATSDFLAGSSNTAAVLTYTIFGMELNNTTKAENYKVLAQGQIPVSAAALYTVGSGLTAFIKTITIINTHTSPCLFTIFSGGTGATNRITPTFTIDPGGMAVYSDCEGWKFFNSFGQQLITGVTQSALFYDRYVLTSALYETIDRSHCDEVNTAALSSGRLSLQAIHIRSGVAINSISFWSATTAGATITNQLFGLYDNNLNLLATSVNDGATAWAANSRKTLALTAQFTTTYTGLYYLGIMVAATTVPTLKGNTAKTGGQLSGGAPSTGGTSTTGLTTALPATAAAPGIVTTSIWGCVS